ncbi:SRPBCC domain-containing protein [Alphaproteobacteria bacterium]|nr:SRPBCC domain-containing protein [Alphaproteobacteria bacterium]
MRTEITIQASPERIWSVLMDFSKYPEWNPFIKSVTGEKKVSGSLDVVVQAPGKNPTNFSPIILTLNENSEFRWKGKFLFEGIFDGEHFFILKNNKNGTTTLSHGENFSGFLVRFFRSSLDKTEQGFRLMNQALKVECEQLR